MKPLVYETILFDLDGTLTDPAEGITNCVRYALQAFGIQETDQEKLELFIGPPLDDSFMEFYGFTPEQAEAARQKYRERFETVGWSENVVYPGIPEMLQSLKRQGKRLAVASSKPEAFVKRILTHFSLHTYFDVVTGASFEGKRVRKEQVMEEALRRLGNPGPEEKQRMVMVGDRKFDVEGGHVYDIRVIGVEYGYAPAGELQMAGSDIIVSSVEELAHELEQ